MTTNPVALTSPFTIARTSPANAVPQPRAMSVILHQLLSIRELHKDGIEVEPVGENSLKMTITLPQGRGREIYSFSPTHNPGEVRGEILIQRPHHAITTQIDAQAATGVVANVIEWADQTNTVYGRLAHLQWDPIALPGFKAAIAPAAAPAPATP